jgi:hypothetical protein
MPSGNKSSLAAKVFHFNVKNHVAGYFLIANRCRLPVEEVFKSNTNVLHFLGNRAIPSATAMLLRCCRRAVTSVAVLSLLASFHAAAFAAAT